MNQEPCPLSTWEKIVDRLEDERVVEIIKNKSSIFVDGDRVTIELRSKKSPKFVLSPYQGKKYKLANKLYIEFYDQGIVVINNEGDNSRIYFKDFDLHKAIFEIKIYALFRGIKLNTKTLKKLEKMMEATCP